VQLFDEEFLKKLEYLHIVSRKVFAGAARAERHSTKVGQGVEFADHRNYAAGDDLRYIDWNVYGRLDRLLLRLFEEEEDLWIYFLLDASASMRFGAPPKFDYARRVVAALSYVGLANLDRVSIASFNDTLGTRLDPTRGKGQIFKVLDFLRGARAQGRTATAQAMQAFVHRSKRRGLAVVVSDLYDPAYEEGLNFLRFHRFDPYVIHLADPAEARPQLKGDVELVDAETGALRTVTVTPRVLARYERAHDAWLRRAEEFARAHAVPYFRAPTDVPFEELVLRIFRAGGFVK
jgi:uncharacterized protein (DUF58 family)